MKTADILKYLISVALAAVLLYFSFRGVNWADFLAGLKNCRWKWIFVAMAAGVMSFWLRGLRWRRLLLPIDRTTSRKVAYNAVCIGNLANLVLPRIGEFVRCGFITRHSAAVQDSSADTDNASAAGKPRMASYDKVLGTVVLERSWDVLTLLCLVAVVMACLWDRFGNFFIDKILTPVMGGLDFSLWWIAAGALLAGCAAVWLLWKLRERSRVASALFRFLKGLLQGVVSCFRMEKWWIFLADTLLIWLMYWLMSESVLLALQGMDTSALTPEFTDAVALLGHMGPLDMLFLMLVGSLSSLVPVPGGFGAFHYIVAAALSTVYGVPFGMGIIFATLSHESQALAMLLSGGVSYVSESMSLIRGR